MKLTKFSVTNFRSITSARHVTLSGTTVLVGKNNEGKSNILKALSVAMGEISNHAGRRWMSSSRMYSNRMLARTSPRNFLSRYGRHYYWHRDFPISLQDEENLEVKDSIFQLEFKLNNKDLKEFIKVFESDITDTLHIKISINSKDRASINVTDGEKENASLDAQSEEIAVFIAEKIFFNYIPAIRTHEEIMSTIDGMVSRGLEELERKPEYSRAMRAISELQKPVFENLAEQIKIPLSEFLPNIKKVEILHSEDFRRNLYKSKSNFRRKDDYREDDYRRKFKVIIDDGVPTDIEYKGDGVQSLAALGLLKNRSSKDSASIIAIEEPESHLHPEAIHQLKEIIESLEGENQIVLTTHNPLFINRQSIESNIIVDSGKANPANKIEEIRNVLGVKISDNLINARFVLVVEGKTDHKILNALLPKLSSIIDRAIRDASLIIKPIAGASYLSYELSTLSSQVCLYHVFFDFDEEAGNAIKKAKDDNLLTDNAVTQATCKGMSASEIEDCIDPQLYKQELFDKQGINIDCSEFKNSKKKWGDRMKDVYHVQGKVWDKETTAKIVKLIIADLVFQNPDNALCKHKGCSIIALIDSLEKLVMGEAKLN